MLAVCLRRRQANGAKFRKFCLRRSRQPHDLPQQNSRLGERAAIKAVRLRNVRIQRARSAHRKNVRHNGNLRLRQQRQPRVAGLPATEHKTQILLRLRRTQRSATRLRKILLSTQCARRRYSFA